MLFSVEMTITAADVFSWPVALWFLVGVALSAITRRLTRQVKVMWQRALFRAAVIALCFTSIPSPWMFAMMGFSPCSTAETSPGPKSGLLASARGLRARAD